MTPYAAPFVVTHPDTAHRVRARQRALTGMWDLTCAACPWTGYAPHRTAARQAAEAHAATGTDDEPAPVPTAVAVPA